MTFLTTTVVSATGVVQSKLLRRALLGNATFSMLRALLFLLWAKPLARLFGLADPGSLIVIGVGLLVFAVAIVRITRRDPIDQQAVVTIIIADVAWVVGSGLILLLGWPPLTIAGKWAVVLVADVVLVLAVLQYWGLRQLRAQ